MKLLCVIILLAFASLTFGTSMGFQDAGKPPGGGGDGEFNKVTVVLTDAGNVCRTSEMQLALMAEQLCEQSDNNPHLEGILLTTESGFGMVAASTNHLLETTSGFSVGASACTDGGFMIMSQSPVNFGSECSKQNIGNIPSVELRDRKVIPPPPGSPPGTPSYYAKKDYTINSAVSFYGCPVDVFFVGFASSSSSNATAPQLTGEYSHSRTVNGVLEINWTITMLDSEGDPTTYTFDPDMPDILPFVPCQFTITFSQRVADGNDSSISLSTMDASTQSTSVHSLSGVTAGGTVSGVSVGIQLPGFF